MTMALPTVTGEFGVVGTPDLRFSSEGKPWMKIRGVAKSRKRGANGAWTDGESTFIDIIVFDVLRSPLKVLA
jgi:single-stranded DNA-binding protein